MRRWRRFCRKTSPACDVVRISHIGSTAVDNIWAKPIVDILVEIASDEDMTAATEIIERSGFYKMSESTDRISFNYGYTEKGFAEKVYHLHLRYAGDNDELYFRDYLNEHPDTAKEYEKLKLSLWRRYEHNRDGIPRPRRNHHKTYGRCKGTIWRPLLTEL